MAAGAQARRGRARGDGLRQGHAAGAGGTGVGRWARRACSRRGAAGRRAREETCEACAKRSGQAGVGGAQGRGRGARGGWLGPLVRNWACQLGQLGARAPGLVFRPSFRLGDVFESPFEPGS